MRVALFIGFFFLAVVAIGKPDQRTCPKDFRALRTASPQPSSKTIEDFRQFLYAEQLSGFYQRPVAPFLLRVGEVPRRRVYVDSDRNTPEALRALLFPTPHRVLWPIHPDNTPKNYTPVFPDLIYENGPVAYYTASRSVVLWNGGTKPPPFSVKLEWGIESEKKDLSQDILNARLLSRHIQEVDKRLGPPSSVWVLPELVTVSEKKSGRGYLVRDLRPLFGSGPALPGFAIPEYQMQGHLSGDSQKMNNQIAKSIGAAKAELLLRYFLMNIFPHGQNIVVSFRRTPNGHEPSRIFLRDVSDMQFVAPLAEAVGSSKIFQQMKERGFTFSRVFGLNDSFSSFLDPMEWRRLELTGFEKEGFQEKVEELLGLKFPLSHNAMQGSTFDAEVLQVLLSEPWLSALRRFHGVTGVNRRTAGK